MSNGRELHIGPGASAGGCMKQALNLPRGSLLDNQDFLSCGPLLPLRTLDEWRRIREEYLQTLSPEFPFSFADYPRDLLTNTQTIQEAESVTVWVGTGLAEQLLLVWVPQLLRLLNIDLQRLRFIQFSYDQNKGEEIQALGILNPDRLRAHPPAEALDELALASIDKAWAAVTAPDPTLLTALLAGEPGPLPFLQRSLQWLMFRFPDAETGLGRLDMQLLRQVAEKGPTAAKVVGFAIIREIDGLDWVGDGFLFARFKRLGAPSLRHPLVSLTGNTAELRETEVHLTETGKRVLEGKANVVELNGIDDWVGGTHLDSTEGRVWFQRNGVLVSDNCGMA
jgi:Domain of unknown function (DUF1835)